MMMAQPPIADEAVDPFERDEQGMGKNREQTVVGGQIQSWTGGRQLLLQLGAYEQFLLDAGPAAGRDRNHRAGRAQQIFLSLHLQLRVVG